MDHKPYKPLLIYGERCSVSEKLRRREADSILPGWWRQVWEPHAWPRSGCIFLGYRTLSNGRVHYDYEGVTEYRPEEHIKVALVSPGPRLNPVYVPLTAITPE